MIIHDDSNQDVEFYQGHGQMPSLKKILVGLK